MPKATTDLKFTSQCGEDRWLAKHWSHLGLPDKGFFVEFGAADGIAFSNTYWIENSRGWRGLLIEADPRHQITSRPNSIVERVAVGTWGAVSFGLDKSDPCLSGILRGSECRIIVDCVPLDSIFNQHDIDRVDLISIDTEGTELEAWRTLDLNRWRPQVAIIELVSWGISDRTDEITYALRDDGYDLLHKTKYNGIFRSVA